MEESIAPPSAEVQKKIFMQNDNEPLTSSLYIKKSVVLLFILFIPPVGWYMIGKDHRFVKWFPLICWLYGGITLFIFLPITVISLPNIYSIYQQVHLPFPLYLFALVGLLDIFSIGEITYGFFIRKKLKNDQLTPSLMKITQVVFFALFYFLVFASVIALCVTVFQLIPKLR